MMRTRRLLAISFISAVAIAAAPAAAAAPVLVVSRPDNTFSNASQTIALGQTVQFSNDPRVGGGGEHNVVWDDNGVRPTPPTAVDTPWTAQRTFTRPGLYRYYCDVHGSRGGVGMAGKVLVRNADGSLPDLGGPRLGRVSTAVARGTFRLRFTASESGTASGKLVRLVGRRFRRFATVSFRVRDGVNRIRFRKTRKGPELVAARYRLTFSVVDRAGNRSAVKRVSFTLPD